MTEEENYSNEEESPPKPVDPHYVELAKSIQSFITIGDWIYHDVRLDCDEGAIERTLERIKTIEVQYGRDSLFGLAGAWIDKAVWRLSKALKRTGHNSDASDFIVPLVSESVDTAALNIAQRGSLSAIQFTKALSNYDLEMREAIFKAASTSSDEDMIALLLGVLGLSISISDKAERLIANM